MTDAAISAAAREIALPLIQEFEGYRGHAYQDSGGVWTIGYGTTRYPDGRKVQPGDRCDKGQAQEWLLNDLERFEACLDRNIHAPLTPRQRAALLSWVYNVGCGALHRSTLRRRLNKGDYESVPFELLRWDKAGGKTLLGLTKRRQKEAEVFLA